MKFPSDSKGYSRSPRTPLQAPKHPTQGAVSDEAAGQCSDKHLTSREVPHVLRTHVRGARWLLYVAGALHATAGSLAIHGLWLPAAMIAATSVPFMAMSKQDGDGIFSIVNAMDAKIQDLCDHLNDALASRREATMQVAELKRGLTGEPGGSQGGLGPSGQIMRKVHWLKKD